MQSRKLEMQAQVNAKSFAGRAPFNYMAAPFRSLWGVWILEKQAPLRRTEYSRLGIDGNTRLILFTIYYAPLQLRMKPDVLSFFQYIHATLGNF